MEDKTEQNSVTTEQIDTKQFAEAVIKIIDTVATRGAFKGEELLFAGSVRQAAIDIIG